MKMGSCFRSYENCFGCNVCLVKKECKAATAIVEVIPEMYKNVHKFNFGQDKRELDLN